MRTIRGIPARPRPGATDGGNALDRAFARAFPDVALAGHDAGLTVRTVAAGETLCRQDDVADGAWLVVSGHFRIVRERGDERRVVADIGAGGLLGESGLLTGGVRNATVLARRTSEVADLSRTWLADVVAQAPGLVSGVVSALQGRVDHQVPAERIVAVLPTRETTGDAGRVADRAADLPGTTVVTAGAGVVALDGLLAAFADEGAGGHRCLLVGDPDDDAWTDALVRVADRVVVLATAAEAERLLPVEHRLPPFADPVAPSRTLVLVHPPDTAWPTGTARRLALRPGYRHLHLRRDDELHEARVARLLTGNGVALALGGGGARALAEVGVHRELCRQGVPVDAVAGTSAGAILGAAIALLERPDELGVAAREGFADVRDPTIPVASMLKGAKVAARLTDRFGDLGIEDLWLPFGCVTTDLTTGTAARHTRGHLTTRLLASAAVPGVFVPVDMDGHVHVDGGLVDNLPVDLAGELAPGGIRIAVDVAPPHGPTAPEPLPRSVSGVALLRDRLLRRPSTVPTIGYTVTQSLLLSAATARTEAAAAADLHLDLSLEEFPLLAFPRVDEIAAAGAARSRTPIEAWVRRQEHPVIPTATPRATTAPPATVDATRARAFGGALWLAGADLRFRLRRFVVAVVAAAVTLCLLLLVTGVVNQLDREPEVTTDALGASHWLLREGIESPFTSNAVFPPDAADSFTAAGETRGILVARLPVTAGGETIDAILVGHPTDGPGAPPVADGRPAAAPGEVALSSELDADPGEEVLLGDQPATVTGVVDDVTLFAGMPLFFVPLDEARALVAGGQPVFSAVLVAGEPGPAPPGFHVRTRGEIVTAAKGPVERPILTLHIVRVLLALVAAMIIGAVVYLASIERTRDVAVLRAVGIEKAMLASGVAAQALAIAVVAAVVAMALQVVLAPVFPLALHLTTADLVVLLVIAAVVAGIASYAAIRRTLKIDPSAAFAGGGG